MALLNPIKTLLIFTLASFLQQASGLYADVIHRLTVRAGEPFNVMCTAPSYATYYQRRFYWFNDRKPIGICSSKYFLYKSTCRSFDDTYELQSGKNHTMSSVYVASAVPSRDSGTWVCVSAATGTYITQTIVTVFGGGNDNSTSTSSTSNHRKPSRRWKEIEELIREIVELKEERNEVKKKEDELIDGKVKLVIGFLVVSLCFVLSILVIISLAVYIWRLKVKIRIDSNYTGLELNQHRDQESHYSSLQSDDLSRSTPEAPPTDNNSSEGDEIRPTRENPNANRPRRDR